MKGDINGWTKPSERDIATLGRASWKLTTTIFALGLMVAYNQYPHRHTSLRPIGGVPGHMQTSNSSKSPWVTSQHQHLGTNHMEMVMKWQHDAVTSPDCRRTTGLMSPHKVQCLSFTRFHYFHCMHYYIRTLIIIGSGNLPFSCYFKDKKFSNIIKLCWYVKEHLIL